MSKYSYLLRILIVLSGLFFSAYSFPQTVIEGIGRTSGTLVRINFNQGVTLERIPATQAAADFWADRLVSSVPIEISMAFQPLSCSANSGILGGASAQSIFRNFDNAPQSSTFYHVALANSYAGRDLDLLQNDINMTFNSDIDNNDNCLSGVNWNYSVSLTSSNGSINFYQVILHEIAHGLGFSDFINPIDGSFLLGFPDAFSLFLRDETTNVNLSEPSTTNEQRLFALTNTGSLVWNGSRVNILAANGGDAQLTSGLTNGMVRMFAPSTFNSGSSVSHYDTLLTPNELMEPFITNAANIDLSLALLYEMGWEEAQVLISTADEDNDSVQNSQDNCPLNANTNQANFDNDVAGDACDTDDDNDGIPDSFEVANNLNPFDAGDAALDADGDGLTNLEEFDAGSDPNTSNFVDSEPNDSIATAQSTVGYFSLEQSDNIGDETTNTSTVIPHATVFGTGNNSFDVYSVEVNQVPARGIFDVDNTNSVDAFLILFDANGTVLSENDDAPTANGQSGSQTHRTVNGVEISLDSFISFQFNQTGTYFIQIGEYNNPAPSGVSPIPVSTGGTYQLQISLEGATVNQGGTDPALQPSLAFDVDGNNQFDALSDGLLLLRYFFGFRGESLINGLIGQGATRTTASEIEAHIEQFMPSN